MRNPITAQVVFSDFSRFVLSIPQNTLEEPIGEQILDVPVAQVKSKIQPDSMLSNFGW